MVYYKEYNTLVIFYYIEEYWDKAIIGYIFRYTFLKKHIYLIE